MEKDNELKNYILKYVKENYVEQRDNPLETLPHVVEPQKCYIDQYNDYKFEFEQLKNLTDKEAKEEEITYRQNQKDDYEEYIAKEKQRLEELNNLIKKVKNWNCPESLKELKILVIEKINSDITQLQKYINYNPGFDAELTGKEYKEKMTIRYQNILDSCMGHVKREQVWADETNRMLKDLKESLGDW